uniref:FHA domain-containing protein n=1 Tax=Mesocestoides corti TaxID=53468 RepID=A0A5K3FS67_MESCO
MKHLSKESSASSRDFVKPSRIKLSPKIKREWRSPSFRTRRRLRSPVIINESEHDVKQKRSRLSSPILVDDDNGMEISNSREQARRSKPERSPLRHAQTDPNRGLKEEHHETADSEIKWGRRVERGEDTRKSKSNKPKEQPNFELSGALAADTNTYKGVVIKYNEPDDARKPSAFWRLYPFKGKEALKVMHIHRQSGYLIGRSQQIADLPMAHPSISKQHAVLQFRFTKGKVRLYVIDLESANGTFLNNKKIEPRRYYELHEKDVLKFGFSTREYVVMTDQLETDSDKDE